MEVLHDGRWCPGYVETLRRAGDGRWRALVTYRSADGLGYYHWRGESELRRRAG